MKKKRTWKVTEIIIEKDEFAVIQRVGKRTSGWCSRCASQVREITPGEAARIAEVSPRTVYRWIEAGQLHFRETADGQLLVCLNSLFEKEIKR